MSETPESSSGSSPGLIVALLALVVALVAIGVAVWALVKGPLSTTDSAQPASVFTGIATDDPKASVCDAFGLVRKGVQLNTNLQAPGGPSDVTGTLAVGANARLALFEGGQYLMARLQPDTPPELADPVRRFANQLMDIGAHSIAGVPNADPDQAARLKDADTYSATITDLCK